MSSKVSFQMLFVCDHSGSMRGTRIELVNDFLTKLKTLPIPPEFENVLYSTLTCFDHAIDHKGTFLFKDIPNTIQSRHGGTNMPLALNHTFDEYLKLLVPGKVVFTFFLTDNTETFSISPDLLKIREDIDEKVKNIQDLFAFDCCLEIESSDKTDLKPLFPENISVTSDKLDTVLDFIVRKIGECMDWAAKRVVIEKYNDDVKEALEKVKEVKIEVTDAVENFETKTSTITNSIVEIQKKIENSLNDGDRLFAEIMSYHKEVAFEELPTEKFVTEWLNPRINLRGFLENEVEKLEEEEKRLMNELEKESENVLELINIKLESRLHLLHRTVTTLSNFVVNASLLGPNVKVKIEQLLSKIKTENLSELDKRFATNDLNQKVRNYKGFILSQKDRILLEAQGSIEDTIKFKADIMKKIKAVLSTSIDPKLEERKKEFRATLKKINRQLKIIKKLVEEVKEEEEEDFNF